MIELSKRFKNDTVVAGQSLSPIIVIAETHRTTYATIDGENLYGDYITDIKFALSLNQHRLWERKAFIVNGEISGLEWEPLKTISSIKNVSSVKISNDYHRKTLKINTLRFNLYNYYDPNKKLSEYINENLMNAEIFLFYKSPSTSAINCYPNIEDSSSDKDCPIIFRGEISRIKVNDDNISITAEDKTQKEISDKLVPYMTVDRLPSDILSGIPDQYKTAEQSVPMVFGKVDRSRAIPFINQNNPRDLNLLFDFCPTSGNYKTSKIPSFFGNNNLPSGNPYFLYVKSGSDYLILDHFTATINMQSFKYSRASLFLTGLGVSADYLLPLLFGEEDSDTFRVYDMVGFQQRMVDRSFATSGSILGLDTVEVSNLSNSDMLNVNSISDNNGFEKRWYRAGEEVFAAGGNFKVLTEYDSSVVQKGDGNVIVLSLEKGVSNELINIDIDGVHAGNTFLMGDFRIFGSPRELGDTDDADSFGGDDNIGGGVFVTPISPEVWSSIESINASLPWSDPTENNAIYAYQAIANLLVAETQSQIDSILADPGSAESQELICPINNFFENASLYHIDGNISDTKYWGSVGGGASGFSGWRDYKDISVNGLHFGSKTSENQDLLVGESPSAHNNIVMFEYFPPYWKNEENGGSSLSYYQQIEMNNAALLHTVKINDIRNQEIFASIEGRKHHMFTEQVDPSLYSVGEINDGLLDNELNLYTKNSDGSEPNLAPLISYWSAILRDVLNPTSSDFDNNPGLQTIPKIDGDTGPYGDQSLLEPLVDTVEGLNFWTADWSDYENGYYETNGQGYDSNGPIGSFAGDGLPFSKLNDWIYNNDFDTILEERWNYYYNVTGVIGVAVGDSIFANSFSLFRNFVYRICQLPVRLAIDFNILYDAQGHNINLFEIYGREFFIKLILEYVFQTDIAWTPGTGYGSWDIKYWYRWKGGPTGNAYLVELTHNLESKLAVPTAGYRDYSWDSFGEMSTLTEWIDNFYLYMDDLSTAYNKCVRELEAEVPDDPNGWFWHFDGQYNPNNKVEWQGRTDFGNWVTGNAWYYGISYFDTGDKLADFRAEMLQMIELAEDEETDPISLNTSGILEKPSDIVMNILTSEMEYGKWTPLDYGGEIQAESTSEIGVDVLKPDYRYFDMPRIEESRLAHHGWQMGFSIDKKTNGKRLIEGILKESKSYPTFTSDGKFSLVTIREIYDDNNIDKRINLNDIIRYNFSQTKREKIVTRIKAYYRYDNGQNKYLSYLDKDISALLPDYKQTATKAYNLEKTDGYKEINLKYHSTRSTVEDYVNYMLMSECNPHNVCDLTLTLNNIDISIGDVIFIPLIKGENVFDINYTEFSYLHSQLIYPYWIILSKEVGLDNVKIKAIQLHHLSTAELRGLTSGGTYDESYGGEEAGEEIFGQTYQYSPRRFTDGSYIPYWNYNPDATVHDDSITAIPYFDANEDGVVNVVDIVDVVNKIIDETTADEGYLERMTTYNSGGEPSGEDLNVTVVVSLVNIILGY